LGRAERLGVLWASGEPVASGAPGAGAGRAVGVVDGCAAAVGGPSPPLSSVSGGSALCWGHDVVGD